MDDVSIINGTIIDGTGKIRYKGNIGIKGQKIKSIGTNYNTTAKKVIDAEGLVVSPGFIDFHSHGDYYLLAEKRAINMLQQGVTTEIAGNCGMSLIPLSEEILLNLRPRVTPDEFLSYKELPRQVHKFMDFLKKDSYGTNLSFLCGHGTIRSIVIGNENRKPTRKEMEEMKTMVREAMEAGAIGMSTGLIYPPGVYAEEEEIIELCKIVAEYGGVYASHVRNESHSIIESIEETIRVAFKADIPTVISHHKIAGRRNWGKSIVTIELIEKANREGAKIRLDQYPYNAGCTELISALPPKFATKSRKELLKSLKEKKVRAEIKDTLLNDTVSFENFIYTCGVDGILIVGALSTPEFTNKTIAQIATELEMNPLDVLLDLLIKNDGFVDSVFFLTGEEDIEKIMSYKYTMGGTDAFYVSERFPALHPRFTGTFVKILSEYIRDKKIVSLEEGIRKLTSMAADMAGFTNKGVIKEGYDADLVIFDYDNLKAKADYSNPDTPNEGIEYVIVNGKVAVSKGEVTGILGGQILFHSGR